MPVERTEASRTTANASTITSSKASFFGGAAGQLRARHSLLDLLSEFCGAFAKLLIGEPLHFRLERVDLRDYRPQAFEQSLVRAPENLCCYFIKYYGHICFSLVSILLRLIPDPQKSISLFTQARR